MDYHKLAVLAAKKAGSIHKKYYKSSLKPQAKSASFDLLTVADRQAEEACVSLIKSNFPGHNIIAEEGSYRQTNSPYCWIIDPLDGTNNFVATLPIFCSSVALAYKGEPIVGVVYDVSRNELFTAQKNRGAFLNGRRIHVSRAKTLEESLLITGFYYSRGKEMLETLQAMQIFLSKGILGVRRLGAAALDLCYVASGRASGFWEFTLSPWDFAAGALLIREAGGTVTDRRGHKVSCMEKAFIVASNGRIHRNMRAVLNDVYSFSR
jgi:myo-inositol-1(or 4)-monophosphatase